MGIIHAEFFNRLLAGHIHRHILDGALFVLPLCVLLFEWALCGSILRDPKCRGVEAALWLEVKGCSRQHYFFLTAKYFATLINTEDTLLGSATVLGAGRVLRVATRWEERGKSEL